MILKTITVYMQEISSSKCKIKNLQLMQTIPEQSRYMQTEFAEV